MDYNPIHARTISRNYALVYISIITSESCFGIQFIIMLWYTYQSHILIMHWCGIGPRGPPPTSAAGVPRHPPRQACGCSSHHPRRCGPGKEARKQGAARASLPAQPSTPYHTPRDSPPTAGAVSADIMRISMCRVWDD